MRSTINTVISWALLAVLVLTLVSCGSAAVESAALAPASVAVDAPLGEPDTETGVEAQAVSEAEEKEESTPVETPSVEFEADDLEASVGEDEMTTISLDGDVITVAGSGVTVEGTIVTIQAAGTYQVSGALNDGQIVVDTQDEETVVLVLAGAEIDSSTSAPIMVSNAEKTVISLADGTENRIADERATLDTDAEADEPNAALFSHDDLTINGSGALVVTGKYQHGIVSKDDLKITGGDITVSAVGDGIKGKDSIAVLDGTIVVDAGGDGLQSHNDTEADKGYVYIEGGSLQITAGLDGIQAETQLAISGGELAITSGGGTSGNADTDSGKGLKAGLDVSISGGVFEIDAGDDAIHSNGSLTIDDGSFLLKSGDDGIHAEHALTINDGEVNIQQAFEGFESGVITINNGDVHLVTSDDGLNATGGAGGEQVDGSYIYINGGYLLIEAWGDGLDSNGTAVISGGVVIVQGAPSQGQGPLDVNGEIEIHGGVLIAAGNASMPEVPSANSTQNSIAIMLDSVQAEGTLVHIETQDGHEVLTFEPANEYQLVAFSSAELATDETYDVYIGGVATGTVTDGLVEGGSYSAGTQIASLEISSSVTTLGSFEGGFGGGGSRRKPW